MQSKKILWIGLLGFSLFFLFHSSPSHAWSFNFFWAKKKGSGAPAELVTPDKIALEITRGLTDDKAKVKAIFDWLTDNIDYDVDTFESGVFTEQTTESALRSKRGVCDVYTNLFNEMANAAGIESSIISGVIFNENSPTREINHAWNKVKIDNKTYYVDATWGAGFYNPQTKTFTKSKNPKYLLADPRFFDLTHRETDESGAFDMSSGLDMDQFKNIRPNTRRLASSGFEISELIQGIIGSKETAFPLVYDSVDKNMHITRAPLILPPANQSVTLQVGHSEETALFIRAGNDEFEFSPVNSKLSEIDFVIPPNQPFSVIYRVADGRYFTLLHYNRVPAHPLAVPVKQNNVASSK